MTSAARRAELKGVHSCTQRYSHSFPAALTIQSLIFTRHGNSTKESQGFEPASACDCQGFCTLCFTKTPHTEHQCAFNKYAVKNALEPELRKKCTAELKFSATKDNNVTVARLGQPPAPTFVLSSQVFMLSKSLLTGPKEMHMSLKLQYLRNSPLSTRHLGPYTPFVIKKMAVAELKCPLRHPSDGKLRPTLYGSNQLFDIGLCYETFYTSEPCRLGDECYWRHEELSIKERLWTGQPTSAT